MTYWRYWELEQAPFCSGNGVPIFRGATVEEALARIEFLVSNERNLGLLKGPSGVGKTTIMRSLTELPPNIDGQAAPRVFRTSMLGLLSGELL